jgi:hypothetical protein
MIVRQKDEIDGRQLVQVDSWVRQARCGDAGPEVDVVTGMEEVGVGEDGDGCEVQEGCRCPDEGEGCVGLRRCGAFGMIMGRLGRRQMRGTGMCSRCRGFIGWIDPEVFHNIFPECGMGREMGRDLQNDLIDL